MWKYFIKAPSPAKLGYEFKMKHSFEKRKTESDMVKNKYNVIPIIVEIDRNSITQLPTLDKTKFGLEREITIGQLIYSIRQRIKIDAGQSIFLFVDTPDNRIIPCNKDTIGEIYDKYADKDGFLYATYSAQQTFG